MISRRHPATFHFRTTEIETAESDLLCREDDVGSDHIMTPEHPLWPYFHAKLSRVYICSGTTHHARAALAELPGIDVTESLRALAELGGTCDCQIELDVPMRANVAS
jgi:hypothetical protein